MIRVPRTRSVRVGRVHEWQAMVYLLSQPLDSQLLHVTYDMYGLSVVNCPDGLLQAALSGMMSTQEQGQHVVRSHASQWVCMPSCVSHAAWQNLQPRSFDTRVRSPPDSLHGLHWHPLLLSYKNLYMD